MKRTSLLITLFALIASMYAQYPGGEDPYHRTSGYGYGDDDYQDHYHPNQPTKRVQLALILDASGSMNGLINQAKSQFWGILNQVNESYGGTYPLVEVAIFDYGSKYASRHNGYVRRLVPLTNDLDSAADKLYDIRTGGRYEFAGEAITQAINNLRWDRSYEVDKMIFIAGNETMDQGRTDFRWAIQKAANRGIAVHTIYCGDYNAGVRHGWADAAYIGGGMFTALDQNAWDDHHYYPQDNDLWSLNTQLNGTYIPYGSYGRDHWGRLRRQDRNAYGYGRSYAAQRAMYKASRSYRCPDWDLVDAVIIGRIDLRTIPASDLPPEMRAMTFAQRQAHIKAKAAERQRIRSKMKQMADSRRETIRREERVPTAATPGRQIQSATARPRRAQSLNQAIRQSVGKKMTKKPVLSSDLSSMSTTQRSTQTRPQMNTNSPTRSSSSRPRSTVVRPQPSASKPYRAPSTVRKVETSRRTVETKPSQERYTRPSSSRQVSKPTQVDRRSTQQRNTREMRSTSSSNTRATTPTRRVVTKPQKTTKPTPRAATQPSRSTSPARTFTPKAKQKTDVKAKSSSAKPTQRTHFKRN
jgi:hypothetical protein